MRFALECITWKGAVTAKGYGRVRDKRTGRTAQPHRLAYEDAFGPLTGRHVHHLCGNPACLELDHMISVSPRQHVLLFGARKHKLQFCKRGHERTPANLDSGGHCRACRNLRERALRRGAPL